jgi:hypothetical protein
VKAANPVSGAFGNQRGTGFLGDDMRIVIMPGFSELLIVVNPTREVTRQGMLSIVMPWLYAPWPEAKAKGVIETEIEGETLRELLTGLAARYRQAGVDMELINPGTNDLDFDYDVTVNGKNYVALAGGLDIKLKADDAVKVRILWRWDG